jgi:hypothetical protein
MRRLRRSRRSPTRTSRAWPRRTRSTAATPTAGAATAERWDFGDVNELIEKHNRWFPIESRLPMDPRTRDFVKVGGREYRRDPLDAAWVLNRFPAATLLRP